MLLNCILRLLVLVKCEILGSSNGTSFGRGSYFARNASYAFKYNQHKLLVARVLVGDVAPGRSSYLKPPPKDATKPFAASFDSCVDNVVSPAIYVTFEFAQAYPAYVIHF